MPSTTRRSINKAKTICGQCKLEVKKEREDNIECDKCAKIFHVLCTKMDKRQFERLCENDEEEFVCHMCDKNHTTVGEELLQIKAQLTKLSKLDQLTELQETMNFMSSKFDEILKGMIENREKIKIIEKENHNLKTEINNLKESVKMLNDHRVKNDCVISGIKEDNSLSAVEMVVKISKTVGVVLEEQNIENAYFIKNKEGSKSSRNLIVKFNSKVSKDKLMSAKPKFKENENTISIYVNDFLSKESLELLRYARTLKSVGYHSVYSYGGKIFARRSAITKPKIIKNEENVNQMLMEATAYQSRRLSRKVIEVDDSDENEDENNNVTPT